MLIQIKEHGKKFAVNLDVQHSLTQKELTKLQQAARHAFDVMNSDSFKLWCWNFSYSGRNHFHDTNLTNEQVYDKLMSGAERLLPVVDNEMDITLLIDHRNKKGVLGYTFKSTIKQWIYNRFFSSANYKQISGNLVHEWCHKMSFGHDYKRTKYREYSVPYAVGYFVARFSS